MTRLVHALLLGVLGAGIVHVAILFLLPVYTERDAWTQLSRLGEPYEAMRLDETSGAAEVPTVGNPFFEAAICRFDLEEQPLHVHAEGRSAFWSMSVYDGTGQNVFSLNDGTATDGRLDFVVLTPAQMPVLRNALPAEFERSIFVETDTGEGIVLVRVFVPDESWRTQVVSYLDSMSCERG